MLDPKKSVGPDDFGSLADVQLVDIFLNHPGGWEVLFDEGCVHRTPAEGFQPECTGPSKQVENVFICDFGSQKIEDGLANLLALLVCFGQRGKALA